MKRLYIVILIVYVFKISSCEVIVETSSGFIRSTASLSPDVEAFLGIPYAEPPVKDRRFAKTVSKQSWDGIYDVSRLPPPCAQYIPEFSYYFMGDLSDMTEDCLYLNIWTPSAALDSDLKPVIIYIHHGTFVSGSSNQKEFDGTHIASRGDVVVVTINYRLGVFGFLMADIAEANGNMAMYDQLMALEWVRENAKNFGGDPQNIVLAGTSAGAVSVGALMLSPLSKHLIRRVFFQSGSIMIPLYLDGNDRLLTNSEQIASMVGCLQGNLTLKSHPESVVACLKSQPAKSLLEAEKTLLNSKPVLFFPRSGDSFLPKDARLMFREGKFGRNIEAMFGTAVDEGCLFLFVAAPDYFGRYGKVSLETMSKSRMTSISRIAGTIGGIPNVVDKINIYSALVKDQTGLGYTKMVTNAMGEFGVTCGNVFLADVLSLAGNPVYYYKFAFRAASTPMADWVQATHLDDIQYMFGNPYHENFTEEEVELSNRFIARLSAFAKTGNPNVPGEVAWKPYTYHDPLYLHIGQEEESLRLRPWNRCEIWRKDFKSEIDTDLIQSLANQRESDSDLDKPLNEDKEFELLFGDHYFNIIKEDGSSSGFKGISETSLVSLIACLGLTFFYKMDFFKYL